MYRLSKAMCAKHRPARKESNIPKVKGIYGLTVLVYTLYIHTTISHPFPYVTSIFRPKLCTIILILSIFFSVSFMRHTFMDSSQNKKA